MLCSGQAQSNYGLGSLLTVNFNQSVSSDWELNFRIESRISAATASSSEDIVWSPEYILSDLALLASRKAGAGGKVAGGYLFRIEGNQTAHRFIQQYARVQRLDGWRLSQRFAADQTIGRADLPEWRLRFRLSAEIPFNGTSVDEGEGYFRMSQETLGKLEGPDADLEFRIVPLMGWVFSESHRLEWGIDYRIDEFIAGAPDQQWRLAIAWFYHR